MLWVYCLQMRRTKQEGLLREQEDAELEEQVKKKEAAHVNIQRTARICSLVHASLCTA